MINKPVLVTLSVLAILAFLFVNRRDVYTQSNSAPVVSAASAQRENRATSFIREREIGRLKNLRKAGISEDVLKDPAKNWKPYSRMEAKYMESRGYDPLNDHSLPPLFFGKPYDDAVFVHAPGVSINCRDLKLTIYTDRVIVERNGTSKTNPIVLTQGEINLDAHNTTDSDVIVGQSLPESRYWKVEFGRVGMDGEEPVPEFTLDFTLQSDSDRDSIRHHRWVGELYGPTIGGYFDCRP